MVVPSRNWQPLLRITASERLRVVRDMEAAALSWKKQWCADEGTSVSVTLYPTTQNESPRAGPAQSIIWFAANLGPTQWIVNVSDQLLARWLGRSTPQVMRNSITSQRGPMADQLLRLVVTSLVSRLSKVDESEVDCEAVDAPKTGCPEDQQWCVRFAEGEESLITLSCPASTVENWLARDIAAARRGGLVARHVAIGSGVVSLRAELGPLKLSLSDLSHLGCGDVLMLPRGADERVALRAANGTTVGYGSLGSISRKRRAVGVSELVGQQQSNQPSDRSGVVKG